jgi:hypothetical protein
LTPSQTGITLIGGEPAELTKVNPFYCG